mmetsp:Transcript_15798/g.28891  ORF Transcript_15798/g.28891 Transcript_15798/m.28891 type:complete len:188 (+) Transcript_15798:38-601(+)
MRVMSQSYTMLNNIHRLKTATYLQRQDNWKALTIDLPTDFPTIEKTEDLPPRPKSTTRHSKPLLKREKAQLYDSSFDAGAPRGNSLERTMTNLSQRPDSFERMKARLLKTKQVKRRFSTQPLPKNIHTQAVRSSMKNYYRSKAYAPFLASKKMKQDNFQELDMSSLVKSITYEQQSIHDSISIHMTL